MASDARTIRDAWAPPVGLPPVTSHPLAKATMAATDRIHRARSERQHRHEEITTSFHAWTSTLREGTVVETPPGSMGDRAAAPTG